MSGIDNHGARAFDISGLANLTLAEYDALEPLRWPVPARGHPGTQRLLRDGRFQFADGRARFVATVPREPTHRTDAEYPWVLNTGRVRDQWHTMTRTGYAPRLTGHTPEPYVEMHPQDALLTGSRSGELVRVSTRWGSMIGRLRLSGEVRRGTVLVPIHWNDAYASDARVGALVNPVVDPVSGEPELKHTPARIAPFIVSWHGFVLSRKPLARLDMTWWTLVRGKNFLRYELAGRRVYREWSTWARQALQVRDLEADWIEYSDPAAGVYRAALLEQGRIAACLFISPRPDLPERSWLAGLFAKPRLEDTDRAGLLMGRPAERRADTGPVVCACFGVGRRVLCDAIATGDLATVTEIGRALRAGTRCGSCVPEIKSLIEDVRAGRQCE